MTEKHETIDAWAHWARSGLIGVAALGVVLSLWAAERDKLVAGVCLVPATLALGFLLMGSRR